MSSWRLTPRDRRALRLGVLVISAVLILTRVLPSMRTRDGQLRDELLATARAADAVERERDELRAASRVARLGGNEEAQRQLESAFNGGSSTEVSAEAAQYVLGVASALGSEVHSVTPRADSTFRGGVLVIEMQLHLTTNAIGLFALLELLATSPRLTAVSTLRVTTENPTATEEVPEALRVEIGLRSLGRYEQAIGRR